MLKNDYHHFYFSFLHSYYASLFIIYWFVGVVICFIDQSVFKIIKNELFNNRYFHYELLLFNQKTFLRVFRDNYTQLPRTSLPFLLQLRQSTIEFRDVGRFTEIGFRKIAILALQFVNGILITTWYMDTMLKVKVLISICKAKKSYH